MNFIEEFKKGQEEKNKGIPFGDGLYNFSRALNGLQKHRVYTVASPPKCGKSTLVDYAFVISPFLYALENNLQIEWVYFSFEIDRISKEFDFMSFFLNHDYGIDKISLEPNQTFTNQGVKQSYIHLSPDYLRGRIVDDEDKIIKVKPAIVEKMKEVYEKRIIPLFGKYSSKGILMKKGMIDFIEQKDNPTGLRNFLLKKAESEGEFIKQTFGKSKRLTGYKPKNPDKLTLIITDHVRKILPERNFTLKQIVDKYIEYCTELRNLCDYSFVHIIHTNRDLANVTNIKFAKEELYPKAEQIKETGRKLTFITAVKNRNILNYYWANSMKAEMLILS